MNRNLLRGALAPLVLVTSAAAAQPEPWALTVYLQRSDPKQTRTNQQIEGLNDVFGVDFDTWDDAVNLNLGAHLLRRVSRRWEAGVELDYSRGSIDGAATIPTEAGPARLVFEQKYSIYADALALAHYLPRPDWERARPFVLAGAGVAYEKDRTTLTLRNEFLDEGLRVDNDGWFPMATVGVGLQAQLSPRRPWYLEAGVAYAWARLEHQVPVSGSLAPAPTITADTDSTGPNVWLGVGRRFGRRP